MCSVAPHDTFLCDGFYCEICVLYNNETNLQRLSVDLSVHLYRSRVLLGHLSLSDGPSQDTKLIMSSHYTRGLELLARVQRMVNEIKLDPMEYHIAVQKCHAFGYVWDALKMALIGTGEAADNAVTASNQQRARHRAYARELIRCSEVRNTQVNACISHFRYVTALSKHARGLRHYHESELLSLKNLRDYYEEALGPQAHIVDTHQTFLDTLGRQIETVERTQRLEMVYMRWIQSRAAAELTQQAKNFHLTCKRLEFRKRRANKEHRRAIHLQKKVAQNLTEYEHLESEVLLVQRAVKAL